LCMHDLLASLMLLYRVKILVKIGPVLAENSLVNGNCAATQLQFDDDRSFVGNYF